MSNATKPRADTLDDGLYNGVSDLAINDATIYAHLHMQQKSGMSDLQTAIALIRSLEKEKKTYFKYAQDASAYSIQPTIRMREDFIPPLTRWQRIKIWLMS